MIRAFALTVTLLVAIPAAAQSPVEQQIRDAEQQYNAPMPPTICRVLSFLADDFVSGCRRDEPTRRRIKPADEVHHRRRKVLSAELSDVQIKVGPGNGGRQLSAAREDASARGVADETYQRPTSVKRTAPEGHLPALLRVGATTQCAA